jgi:ATP-dependent Lon protease
MQDSSFLPKDRLHKTSYTPHYKVFQSDQAVNLIRAIRSADSDANDRISLIYSALLQSGSCLRSVRMPNGLDALLKLLSTQPQFKLVTTFFLQQVALSLTSKRPLRIPPTLIVGEPGIGKTFYVYELAKALNTAVHLLALDSELTSSTLLGSDEKWGNSKHGLLFESLVLGSIANPVILLEELDKARSVNSHTSPVSTLYSVLETVSAQNLCDISLNFILDGSQITWIGTANDISQINEPLISRFQVFHIEPPSAEDCLIIAKHVAQSTIESLDIEGFSTDTSWSRHIAHLPARKIQSLVKKAVGRAVFENRMHLNHSDFTGDIEGASNSIGQSIRYLH